MSAAGRPARPRRSGRGMARSRRLARGVGHGRVAHGGRDVVERLERRRCPVPPCGAVWRSRRTWHERSASNTTSADAQRLVLVGGMGPRVVELVEDVGVDAARAPLAVPRLGRALALDGHVVRDGSRRGPRRTGSVVRAGRRRAGPARQEDAR